jgi:quercetin dioxygenase-like cupin family protein
MRNRLATSMAVVALISTSVLGSTSALGDEIVMPLLKQAIQDGMEVNILRLEAEPGFETERHFHPGHVFVYVLDGTVELVVDGEDTVRLSAGEVGYEQPNKPMVGRNASSTERVSAIVFQIGEAGKPLQVDQPK